MDVVSFFIVVVFCRPCGIYSPRILISVGFGTEWLSIYTVMFCARGVLGFFRMSNSDFSGAHWRPLSLAYWSTVSAAA